ncbi:MAG TPA: porin family protein [Rudaea sp.]|jgi:OOP family OmpA-OmpF porin/outer membrane immunogenic protein|nr:porin family protein [Rudaea sp.]
MKNTILAIALAASAFALPAISHADSSDNGNGGFFVNGNVGQSDLDKGLYNDHDTGYGANVGYRWAFSPNVAIGVEGGYTKLGTFDPKENSDIAGTFPRASVEGWNLGLNGHFNLSPNWYVSARGGYFRSDVKGETFPSIATATFVDATSNKYYAGAGFGYDFSKNVSVGLNYDYYKTDTDGLQLDPRLISVSGEYRF